MSVMEISVRVFVFGLTLLTGMAAVTASRFLSSPFVADIKSSISNERVSSRVETDQAFAAHTIEPVVTDNISFDFDPTGTYSLDLEKTPKAFADIEFIVIETREYTEKNGTYMNRPIVPTGSLQAGNTLNFTRIAVGNREISFETEPKHGISFKFVGNFPETVETINCEGCDYPPDLKGRLTKLKNGNVIAELDANLYVFGC